MFRRVNFEVKPKKVAAPDGRGKVDDYLDVGKALLNDPNKFLKSLFDFDKENIPEKVTFHQTPPWSGLAARVPEPAPVCGPCHGQIHSLILTNGLHGRVSHLPIL